MGITRIDVREYPEFIRIWSKNNDSILQNLINNGCKTAIEIDFWIFDLTEKELTVFLLKWS